MTTHDDTLFLTLMLERARLALQKTAGVDRAGFEEDETLRLAVAFLVQNVGEAACGVASETKDSHPEIAWHQITGMRHRIVHD